MYYRELRPAVAMIELIFALVIMGIVLMSAPQMISTATKSSYVTIQQESISEAASQVNMILGYHWDEQDTNESFIDPILSVNAGDSELNVSGTTGKRKGTPSSSERSFVRNDGQHDIPATPASDLGTEGTEPIEDDMDDFEGKTTHLTLEGSYAGNTETTTIEINSTVFYLNDAANYNSALITYSPTTPQSDSTNIKGIGVNVSSTSDAEELDKLIVLWAFSCNVGGYKLEQHSY